MTRNTLQRQAIRDVFDRTSRPLGPHDVLDLAKEKMPRIGIATIYRTIKLFVEQGVLVPVEIPGEAPRYELGGKGHHHHFYCRFCRKLFVIDDCLGDFERLRPEGFRLEEHILILSGVCKDCLPSSESSPSEE